MKQYEKCKHCCECIYYEKCAVNAPYRMECNQLKKILCGFTVCCEDFISRYVSNNGGYLDILRYPVYNDSKGGDIL